ncbi:MAG: DUF2948 family protein [Dongiaceae bacterium]
MAEERLRLGARDADDLAVIASFVQDALVPTIDMGYLPEEKRFVLALNRFRWDRMDAGTLAEARAGRRPSAHAGDASFWEEGDKGPAFERVMSGLRFESVTAVRTKGIDLRNRERILELLTIHAEPGVILLVFSGSAIIRLEVEELRCYLEDFGDAWPTRWRPHHSDDGAGSAHR